MNSQQVEAPKETTGPRLLGKWDYIGCAIVALLAALGNHVLSAGLAGIEYMIGQFIGVLVLWALLKMVFLWVKRKLA